MTKPEWQHMCLQHGLLNILSLMLRPTAQKIQDANCSGSAPDIDRVSRTVHINQFLINICMNERIDID